MKDIKAQLQEQINTIKSLNETAKRGKTRNVPTKEDMIMVLNENGHRIKWSHKQYNNYTRINMFDGVIFSLTDAAQLEATKLLRVEYIKYLEKLLAEME